MQILSNLLLGTTTKQVIGNLQVPIMKLCIDSRNIVAQSCFIAIKGNAVNGHNFISIALASGATAIVCEVLPENIQEEIAYILVENASTAAAEMAKIFYNNPSANCKLIGVTGTNGKTTIATLLFKLFRELGYNCGLISTVQNQINEVIIPATHTTPDAINLNDLLAEMVYKSECNYIFMECSSHAIHQHRIHGLIFAAGIFTNITHDHLDYHKTFDEYIRVKKSFFDQLPTSAFAISNIDDKRGEVMLQNTKAKKVTYSLKNTATIKGKIIDNSLSGLVMMVNDIEVHFRLIGEFNAYNLLAVYATAIKLGVSTENTLLTLSKLQGAEGRFDYLVSATGILAIVDYAHTPDALENVLTTIKKLRKGYEHIITVVGCGGNRDKTKRPLMAQAACNYSDKVIFTSDNPRNENAQSIINDMLDGLNSAARRKYIEVIDRKEAIRQAVLAARKDDIILVAGKGHEKYQEILGIKQPFDDKEVLAEMFKNCNK